MLTTKLSANHQNHVMCVPDLGMLFMFLVGMSFIVYGYHYLHDAWWVIYINIIYTGKLLSCLLFSFTPYLGMKIRRGREDPYYYSSGCRNGKHVESQPGYQHQKKVPVFLIFQCRFLLHSTKLMLFDLLKKKSFSAVENMCCHDHCKTRRLQGFKNTKMFWTKYLELVTLKFYKSTFYIRVTLFLHI